jgi:hypothetical protein
MSRSAGIADRSSQRAGWCRFLTYHHRQHRHAHAHMRARRAGAGSLQCRCFRAPCARAWPARPAPPRRREPVFTVGVTFARSLPPPPPRPFKT